MSVEYAVQKLFSESWRAYEGHPVWTFKGHSHFANINPNWSNNSSVWTLL